MSLRLFPVEQIFPRSLSAPFFKTVSLLRVTKIISRISVSRTHSLPFLFLPLLTQWNGYISESHTSLKRSFTNIRVLRLNFAECDLSLNQTRLTFLLYVRRTLVTQFWKFLFEGLSSFNTKGFYYSCAWSWSLCEEGASFCTGLISRNVCRFVLMFLTGFTPFIVLLLFPLSITLFIFVRSFQC